jgi:transcriptional regulator with XRE-family HTH domain
MREIADKANISKEQRDIASALIIKAMRRKSQEAFCRQAKLSRANFSRFLREGESIPSKSTLLKIAECSGGEVSYNELLAAWGYGEEDSSEDKWGKDMMRSVRNVCEAYTAKAPYFRIEELHAELVELETMLKTENGLYVSAYGEVAEEYSSLTHAVIPVHIQITSSARNLVFETDIVFYGIFGRENGVVVRSYSTAVEELLMHPMPYSCDIIREFENLCTEENLEALEDFEEDPYYFEVSELALHGKTLKKMTQTGYNPLELSECSLTEQIRAIKEQQNNLSLLLAEKEALLKAEEEQNKEK